jgi:endonuclease III
MNSVRFNAERAERILSEAHDMYMKERLLYSRVGIERAPQNTCIPQGVTRGSFAHGLFLYFTTLITYASESEMGFRQSARLFENHPHLFSEELLRVDVGHVGKHLREVGFVRPEQGAKYWHGSGVTLVREYDNDPLQIFAVENVDEFLSKKAILRKRLGKDGLPGIGPKIFSLMALFFEELGLIGEMPGAFPVDLHVQRICISLGIVEGGGIIDATFLAEFLRPKIYDICRRLGMRPLNLSHALWFLGNRVCTRCSLVEGIEHVCPVVHHCGGAIPSLIYARKGKWNFDAPRLQKGSPQYSIFDDNPEVLLDAAQDGRRRKLIKMY